MLYKKYHIRFYLILIININLFNSEAGFI